MPNKVGLTTSYTFCNWKEAAKYQKCPMESSWRGATQWKTMKVIIYYIDMIMVYIQLRLKVKLSWLFPVSHCCSALYNSFRSSSPPAPAIILECAVENEPVFSDTPLVVRDASCWTSVSYKAFFGGGVDGAETQAQIAEKKRSLSSWPSRVKTRPGCCTLSLHCLLKCWHLGLNEVFKFSQNILEMLYGKTPSLFLC